MSKKEIKELLVKELKKEGVIKAALFGSIARGEQSQDSDIDIIVQFEEGKSLLDLAGLKVKLEEIFKKKVDVITYNSIHPQLKKYIEKDQELLYA